MYFGICLLISPHYKILMRIIYQVESYSKNFAMFLLYIPRSI